jgi:DnaK suppressor protein
MDTAPYQVSLAQELDTLGDESREASEARAPVELDQQSVGRLSRMDALQVQAMAQKTERRRQTRMAALRAALKRIDDGTFGACLACGEDIAPKRLEFDPASATCIDCAGGGSGRRGA